ncbi:hypothetical protein ABIA39_007759 [Nocardia sp. GAS34]|uniref:hypothetical protein n=1 Tax=unclassified Nocardia TaxID=2637762 RepID=UPI003D23C5AC
MLTVFARLHLFNRTGNISSNITSRGGHYTHLTDLGATAAASTSAGGLAANHLAFVLAILLAFAIATIFAVAVGFFYKLDGGRTIGAMKCGGAAFATVVGIGIAVITLCCAMT